MAKRGRPPLGTKHVDRLLGSEAAKRRLKIVLATLSGEQTIPQACAELGIGETRFSDLRTAFLEQGVLALEPKPQGRPPRPEVTDLERENLRLHRENQQLKLEIQGSLIREEIALTMPHLLKPSKGKKTKGPSSRASTKRNPGGSCGTKRSSGASGKSTT